MINLRVLIVICALVGIIYQRYLRKKAVRYPLPPGPKPLPILGNILDLPPKDLPEFQHWITHKDKYGGISSVSVMGNTIIIIHDKDIADDILNKNALKSSDRPTAVFASELCGFGEFMIMRQNDASFRHQRKLMHRVMGSHEALGKFTDLQHQEVERFLGRVLDTPKDLFAHLQTEIGSTILKMTYGYSTDRDKADPLVQLVERMIANMSVAAKPMAWVVDIFPFLRHLPNGFPGTSFKETARVWKEGIQLVMDKPYAFVQRTMAIGDTRPSFVQGLIEQGSQDSPDSTLSYEDERDLKLAAAQMYMGGAGTTGDTLKAFILAMILFPEVQSKGQEEIDRVVGTSRLPRFEDRENLPYVDGIVKEILRWSPIASMGFPHVVTETMEYRGYTIPKGAMVMAAIWWFLNDPNVYHNPSTIDPDRYLAPRNEPDPKSEAFGHGRRVCPGKLVGDSNLFLLIAHTLAVFDVGMAVDESGREMRPEHQFVPGVVSGIRNFPYKISPRNEQKVELVRRAEKGHPKMESDSGSMEV